MKRSFAVIVVTCDNYSDAWEPFFKCFEKYWEDNEYKIYLINNEKDYSYPGLSVINTGPEKSWSRKMRTALPKVEEEYVLLLLEDYFLVEDVNSEKLEELMAFVLKNGVDYLSLTRAKEGLEPTDNKYIFKITENNNYGKILQPAIWKKSYLEKCLYDDDFSAWEFESRQKMKNAMRIKGNDYCVLNNAISWANGILQGKWFGPSVKRLKNIGIDVDTSKRPVLSLGKTIQYKMKMRIYCSLSVSGIHKLRKIISRCGFKFITKN